MTDSRVTLKLLSKHTGFDESTISRALRGDKTLSIRSENLQKIIKKAEELGYVPNIVGRSLRSSRSHTLGLVLPSLQNHIHAQIVEGAHQVCVDQGYSLIMAYSESPDKQLEVIIRLIEKNRIEGLLALTFQNELRSSPHLDKFRIPVAAVNWSSAEFENWVVVNERQGAATAVKHLIDLGHVRIAHIGGDLRRYNAAERHQGYVDALATAGIPYDPNLVAQSDYNSYQNGAKAMEDLLDKNAQPFSAVFALSLLPAAGALGVLRKRKIDVPSQMSIVAFHDGLIADVLSPTLTTVAFDLPAVGRLAAQGMIDVVEKKCKHFCKVIDGGRIVQRESTAALGHLQI